MKITLKINGEQTDFTVGYINMMTVRRAMEFIDMDLTKISYSDLDKIIDFIVSAFDDQFTREEFYKGYSAKGFVDNVISILNEIIAMVIKSADSGE